MRTYCFQLLACTAVLIVFTAATEHLVEMLIRVLTRMHKEQSVKRPVYSADEQDLVNGWRRVVASFKRPGYAAKIKRGLRRRYRRDEKLMLRTRPEEM